MTQPLSQRLFLLAAAAVLAGVVAVAVVAKHGREAGASPTFTSTPASGGWNHAFAGSRGPVGDAQRTTCGQVLTAKSLGVTVPALPCGAKLVLRYGSSQVLTEVIDNQFAESGHDLEVTEKLARILGLEGTAQIEWRFATEAGG